jgi:hypothetical protein
LTPWLAQFAQPFLGILHKRGSIGRQHWHPHPHWPLCRSGQRSGVRVELVGK